MNCSTPTAARGSPSFLGTVARPHDVRRDPHPPGARPLRGPRPAAGAARPRRCARSSRNWSRRCTPTSAATRTPPRPFAGLQAANDALKATGSRTRHLLREQRRPPDRPSAVAPVLGDDRLDARPRRGGGLFGAGGVCRIAFGEDAVAVEPVTHLVPPEREPTRAARARVLVDGRAALRGALEGRSSAPRSPPGWRSRGGATARAGRGAARGGAVGPAAAGADGPEGRPSRLVK